MPERARKRYEDLTPEQRAAVDRIRARHSTPEYRAEEARVRALVEEEFPPKYPRGSRRVDEAPPELAVALAQAREERVRRGLSLTDAAARSGLDKALISRLETGKVANPTVVTLARYAAAVGLRLDIRCVAD